METIFVKRLSFVFDIIVLLRSVCFDLSCPLYCLYMCIYDSGWIEEYTLTRDLMAYFLLCIDKSGLYNKKHIRNKNSVSTQEFGFFIFERFRLDCNRAAWELFFFSRPAATVRTVSLTFFKFNLVPSVETKKITFQNPGKFLILFINKPKIHSVFIFLGWSMH